MSEAPFIAAKIGDDCLAAEDCAIFDSLFVPQGHAHKSHRRWIGVRGREGGYA